MYIYKVKNVVFENFGVVLIFKIKENFIQQILHVDFVEQINWFGLQLPYNWFIKACVSFSFWSENDSS